MKVTIASRDIQVGTQNSPSLNATIGNVTNGAAKDGNTIEGIAATNLSGQRAVASDSVGQFVYASNDNREQINCITGITKGAANLGAVVTVVNNQKIREESWTWLPTKPIFLGQDGQLTQVYPNAPLIVILGWALDPKEMYVQIQTRTLAIAL